MISLQALIEKQLLWPKTMPNATIGDLIQLDELIERKFKQLHAEVHFKKNNIVSGFYQ